MKIIVFLAVVALSAVEGRRNAVEELKGMFQITRQFLDMDPANTRAFGVQIQRALHKLKNIGVGLGGGGGVVEWKRAMGRRTYKKGLALGGEIEIKFGRCNTVGAAPRGNANQTWAYQGLKALIDLSGIFSQGKISAQYPDNLFYNFGNGEASVSDGNLRKPCREGQLRDAKVVGEFPSGDVAGEEMTVGEGVADACDPSGGTAEAEGKGVTGSGNITASGIGYAMAFANGVDLATAF